VRPREPAEIEPVTGLLNEAARKRGFAFRSPKHTQLAMRAKTALLARDNAAEL
jgi:hypothetical protein